MGLNNFNFHFIKNFVALNHITEFIYMKWSSSFSPRGTVNSRGLPKTGCALPGAHPDGVFVICCHLAWARYNSKLMTATTNSFLEFLRLKIKNSRNSSKACFKNCDKLRTLPLSTGHFEL